MQAKSSVDWLLASQAEITSSEAMGASHAHNLARATKEYE